MKSGFVRSEFEGRLIRIDREADMGYLLVRPHRHIDHTDLKDKRDGVLADRNADGTLLGIEIFLRDGEIRPESAAVIRRLLRRAPRR